jgi:hypothetical protein
MSSLSVSPISYPPRWNQTTISLKVKELIHIEKWQGTPYLLMGQKKGKA